MVPPARDGQRVSRPLGTSVLLRAADRVIVIVWHAAFHSSAARWFTWSSRVWLAFAPGERRTVVGVGLLAAVASHLGLTVIHDIPAGWLWLVPPGIAVTVGLMLLTWPGSSPEGVD